MTFRVHRSPPWHPRRHSGQAVVEFALILPVTMLILLGMIELGRGFVFGVSVQDGTREAARLAAKAGYDTNVTDAAVRNRLVAASVPALGSTCTIANWGAPPTICGGETWTVSINIVNGGSSYASIAAARLAGPLTGAQVTINAASAIGLVPGLNTGMPGFTIANVGVQGQAVMVIL